MRSFLCMCGKCMCTICPVIQVNGSGDHKQETNIETEQNGAETKLTDGDSKPEIAAEEKNVEGEGEQQEEQHTTGKGLLCQVAPLPGFKSTTYFISAHTPLCIHVASFRQDSTSNVTPPPCIHFSSLVVMIPTQ